MSAGAILVNHLLRRGLKTMRRLLAGQGLEISQGLATRVARITAHCLLQITKSLLNQAVVILAGTLLKKLMQRI
jgi:hypothetical protein